MRQFGLRKQNVTVTVSLDGEFDGDVLLSLFQTDGRGEVIARLTDDDVNDLIRALIFESEKRSLRHG